MIFFLLKPVIVKTKLVWQEWGKGEAEMHVGEVMLKGKDGALLQTR